MRKFLLLVIFIGIATWEYGIYFYKTDKAVIVEVDMLEFLQTTGGVELISSKFAPKYGSIEVRISDDITANLSSHFYKKKCYECYAMVNYHGKTISSDTPPRNVDNFWGHVIGLDHKGLVKAKKCGIDKVYYDKDLNIAFTDIQIEGIRYLVDDGEVYGSIDWDTQSFNPTAYIYDSMAVADGAIIKSPTLSSGGYADNSSYLYSYDDFLRLSESNE